MEGESIQDTLVSRTNLPGLCEPVSADQAQRHDENGDGSNQAEAPDHAGLSFGKTRMSRNASSGRKITASSSVIACLPPGRWRAARRPIPAQPRPRNCGCCRIAASAERLPMPRARDADAVHRAVDQAGVNAAPQNDARAFDQRLHDGGVIDFIDEIFVVDQPVEAAERTWRTNQPDRVGDVEDDRRWRCRSGRPRRREPARRLVLSAFSPNIGSSQCGMLMNPPPSESAASSMSGPVITSGDS